MLRQNLTLKNQSLKSSETFNKKALMNIKNTFLLSLLAATSSITFISAAEGNNPKPDLFKLKLQFMQEDHEKLQSAVEEIPNSTALKRMLANSQKKITDTIAREKEIRAEFEAQFKAQAALEAKNKNQQ